MLKQTKRLILTYVLAAAIVFILMWFATSSIDFSLIVLIVVILIFGIHFLLYENFPGIGARLSQALKPKPYWVPRIFGIYILNWLLIFYAARTITYSFKAESFYLFLAGLFAFLIEWLIHKKNGHSIQDLLYFPSYSRLRERKKNSYWLQSVLFTIIVFSLLIMLYLDCMIVIVTMHQMFML